jgi:DNA-binding XRE family transcriptional regulator
MDIKAARLKLGLSQAALGIALGGIPRRTIQEWESGRRNPPTYVAVMVQEKLDALNDDITIRRRYNEAFALYEFNAGTGWRTYLLAAMEEAGHPIAMQPLSDYLRAAAIMRGLDEGVALDLAQRIEKHFGTLEVPKDLNPSHFE